ncbi:mRNA capping enzyme, catalytic domain-containing protein [Halteromyces radiatus]|uniref:mRNA capping enzyme, catalytic domain-containing protein n=1 Tax=Halteromyces radiatus TaxID=101107 RepID=UPI00221FE92F|nr:mRNA capping enzyme, catalytic domain-containing protein [Halteromyces radiatus]KAI8096636.1 mRNA capping enzyme, catalytic domain-containing protein [Halteromyces radiatus]
MATMQPSSQPTSSIVGPTSQQDLSTFPDHIGKRVDPVYSQTLHARVKELLQYPQNGFPGSQPVSFVSKHLAILEREDYFVCEKSDGIRGLLLFLHSPKGPASFMLDRNQIWYYIPNLLFPVRQRENEYLKDTLMDGELVVDKDQTKKTWRYLIFDLMAVNGQSIVQRSFSTRLGMLQQDVIHPFKNSLRLQSDPNKVPPFTIELKKMERSYGLHLVFDQMTRLRHESDGIIWTPVKCPYVPNICEKLLKWKPPEKNTVDFRINAKWSKDHKPIYSLDVLSHVTYKFFDHFQPDPDWAFEWKDQPPDGRIAEFRYDPNWQVTIVEQGYAPVTRTGGWRFVRFRDDKDAANEENDVKRILNSIQDGVSKEQLLAHMETIRDAWKAREAREAKEAREIREAREKGLPPPAHLKNRERLSISSVSTSSSSNQALVTPTGTSPVVPSPATGNFSGQGYFPKSRQSSLDYGSTDRRFSGADPMVGTYTESSHGDTTDIKNNGINYNTATSLPTSRRQSTETTSKRDNNHANEIVETERKRHKSLTELDRSRQQINDERRMKAPLEEHADTNDTSLMNNKSEQRIEDDTAAIESTLKTQNMVTSVKELSSAEEEPLVKAEVKETNTAQITIPEQTTISQPSKITPDEINPTATPKQSKTNNRRRKASDNEHRQLYEDDSAQEPSNSKKVRKVHDTSLSTPTVESKQLSKQQHQTIMSTESVSSVSDRDKRTMESTNHEQRYTQQTSPILHPGQNENGATPFESSLQHQTAAYSRYDPARSPPPPPPSSSSSSSSSIPRSPPVMNTQQRGKTAISPVVSPVSTTSTNNKKASSNSIHSLLTSSVEPIPSPAKRLESVNEKSATASSYPTSRSYNLSAILRDDDQKTDKYSSGFRANEQQNISYQPNQPERTQEQITTSCSSVTRTPPVQFINFHAERSRSQGSPTSRHKTVFIQGEYHNNTANSPGKSRSGTSTPSLQQQTGIQSPQMTSAPVMKTNNHRPSQTTMQNASVSPSSSPRESRHQHQTSVWKATVGQQATVAQQQYQQQSSIQPEYIRENYSSTPTSHQLINRGYPSPSSNHHYSPSSYYPQQQPPPPPPSPSSRQTHSNYNHHGHTGPQHGYHYMQHNRSAYEQPTEYYADSSPGQQQYPHPPPPPSASSSHYNGSRPYRPQTSYHSIAPATTPPKDSGKKSSKAKLDFILN